MWHHRSVRDGRHPLLHTISISWNLRGTRIRPYKRKLRRSCVRRVCELFECVVFAVASLTCLDVLAAFRPRRPRRLPASMRPDGRSEDRLAGRYRRRAPAADPCLVLRPIERPTGSQGARNGRGWPSCVRRRHQRRPDVATSATVAPAYRYGSGPRSHRPTWSTFVGASSVQFRSYSGTGRRLDGRRTTSTPCYCPSPSSCRRHGAAVPAAKPAPPLPTRPTRTRTRCRCVWSDHHQVLLRLPPSRRRQRRPLDVETTSQRRRCEHTLQTLPCRKSRRQNSAASGHVPVVRDPEDAFPDFVACASSYTPVT